MKTLANHINEALKIGKDISSFSTYSYQPKTREELKEIIANKIANEGTRCNLNDIDVSQVESMSYLFYKSKFNGDISGWNVSNVKNMMGMFLYSDFTGDISRWNVSNVTNMKNMFANSNFNSDISNWNVSKVKYMAYMFACSKFNQNISDWKISNGCDTDYMFLECPIRKEFKSKLSRWSR